MEAFEPKWVNPVLKTIGVNTLRLGGLQILLRFLRNNHNIIRFFERFKKIRFYMEASKPK